MLAHHNVLIGARWYLLRHRAAIVSDRSHPNDKSNGSSAQHQGTS
jgi:hypothetical protein